MPELPLKPSRSAQTILSITRSKAKMYEFEVPSEEHIEIKVDPSDLLPLAIGILGDLAAAINDGDSELAERNSTRFSAFFFDAYSKSRLREGFDEYFNLIAAAGYYLADLPGSATVLANSVNFGSEAFNRYGIEEAVSSAIRGEASPYGNEPTSRLRLLSGRVLERLGGFMETGESASTTRGIKELRELAYTSSSDDQLFFVDVFCAIVRKRIERSVWKNLPQMSGLAVDVWRETFAKAHFPKELWPAQVLLGTKGVYAGKSAVVQMPTSAGKTKAIEIIIRSAFFSNRTTMAVIVAPFRALCHEISDDMRFAFKGEDVAIDELSDVPQGDFLEFTHVQGRVVIIVTPEKLLYMLRQEPLLGTRAGLLVYDEGHQFDTGYRGVTFELLLASLRQVTGELGQTILISAVIAGAQQISQWLLSDRGQVITGDELGTTYRTTAFVSQGKSRLEYVENANPDAMEFFVPYILRKHELKLHGKERNPRFFPRPADALSSGLYLSLKLCHGGTVALFSGTRDSAIGLCWDLVDAYLRDLDLRPPSDTGDSAEIARMVRQYEDNLGSEPEVTLAMKLGVASHHTRIPFGIRMCAEEALRMRHVSMVICTSTLAQGVNMPIRYLVLPGVKQGGAQISRRDFQNLVGRAGRAGMHTEGSVIFATPLYDLRKKQDYRDQWVDFSKLLRPPTDDDCASSIAALFTPLETRNKNRSAKIDVARLAEAYCGEGTYITDINDGIDAFFKTPSHREYPRLQLQAKLDVLEAIECFLMAHDITAEVTAASLAEQTLAYSLLDPEKKEILKRVFEILAERVEAAVPDAARRRAFSRTLFGVTANLDIEAWVIENVDIILRSNDGAELLSTLWPLFEKFVENEKFSKMTCSSEVKLEFAQAWIAGTPFHAIHRILQRFETRMGPTPTARFASIYHTVELCENALGYDGILIMAAVKESLKLLGHDDDSAIVENCDLLQQRLRYGLFSETDVGIYELGFQDRCLTRMLSQCSGVAGITKKKRLRAKLQSEECRARVQEYPSIFERKLEQLKARD